MGWGRKLNDTVVTEVRVCRPQRVSGNEVAKASLANSHLGMHVVATGPSMLGYRPALVAATRRRNLGADGEHANRPNAACQETEQVVTLVEGRVAEEAPLLSVCAPPSAF